MRSLPTVLCTVLALLQVPASAGEAPLEQAGPCSLTAADPSAGCVLPAVWSHGCSFELTAEHQPDAWPHRYDVVLIRKPSPLCRWGHGRRVLASSFQPPRLSLQASTLGIAVGYTHSERLGGSAPTTLHVQDVALDTLQPRRSAEMRVWHEPHTGHILQGVLWLYGANTLVVSGTKAGTFPHEQGAHRYYLAIFENFFTSSAPPRIHCF
jgi:hypothetical protein